MNFDEYVLEAFEEDAALNCAAMVKIMARIARNRGHGRVPEMGGWRVEAYHPSIPPGYYWEELGGGFLYESGTRNTRCIVYRGGAIADNWTRSTIWRCDSASDLRYEGFAAEVEQEIISCPRNTRQKGEVERILAAASRGEGGDEAEALLEWGWANIPEQKVWLP